MPRRPRDHDYHRRRRDPRGTGAFSGSMRIYPQTIYRGPDKRTHPAAGGRREMSTAPELAPDKWLALLEHSAHEVFDIMLKTKLEPGGPEPATGIEFTAMVGLAGIVCGV